MNQVALMVPFHPNAPRHTQTAQPAPTVDSDNQHGEKDHESALSALGCAVLGCHSTAVRDTKKAKGIVLCRVSRRCFLRQPHSARPLQEHSGSAQLPLDPYGHQQAGFKRSSRL